MDTGTESLLVVILLATVVLRLLLVGIVVWLLVPRRRTCPHCSEVTVPILESAYLKYLLLERRWCLGCGWSGIARKTWRSGAGGSVPSRHTVTLLLALAAWSCNPAPRADPVAAIFSNGAQWIDLSHAFDEQTIYWPTAEPFRMKMVSEGQTPGGYFYAAANFSAAEHGGTHLDAPVHFAEGKLTSDRIPLSRLMGPAAVLDVTAQAAANPDYRVTAADIQAFEAAHGPIAEGTVLLIRTGWGARWPDRKAYLGTDATGPGAVPQLHFPGFDSTAARWIVESKRIDAVGIDTPSIDHGQSTTFDVHRILFAEDIPAFENVAGLDRLPATGAYVVALPMKIAKGTGGPLRIVGVIPAR